MSCSRIPIWATLPARKSSSPPMNFQQRLADICRRMRDERLDLLIGLHDGTHFIETPNPVMVMSGFKSIGAAAVLLRADGNSDLIVTPAWDEERAAEGCPEARCVGTNHFVKQLLARAGD